MKKFIAVLLMTFGVIDASYAAFQTLSRVGSLVTSMLRTVPLNTMTVEITKIPTTQYVQKYLREYCENPDLVLNNVDAKKIPSEKYVLSAIDEINNGHTMYSDDARDGVVVTLDYLESVVGKLNKTVNCCRVPWDTETAIAAVGAGGEIAWTNETMTGKNITARQWRSVAYGAGKFVAVSYDGAYAAYSDDGINWTESDLPARKYWFNVMWQNDKFIALATGTNMAAWSSDGITWNEMTMSGSETAKWRMTAYGNGKYVAVATESKTAAVSDNGINWTETTISGTNSKWTLVAYGNDTFVALKSGTGISAVSTNGSDWASSDSDGTEYGPGTPKNWFGLAFGAGKFVAIAAASDTVVISSDGKTWETVTLPVSATWRYLTYGGGQFVAVAENSDIVISSGDGVNWYQSSMETVQNWYSVAYGNGKYVATMSNKSTTIAMGIGAGGSEWLVGEMCYTIETDEITECTPEIPGTLKWTGYPDALPVHSDSDIWMFAYSPELNRFVGGFLFNSDVVAYSDDGITWIQKSLSISAPWASVTWGGDKFVATGGWSLAPSNISVYSYDGITWYQSPNGLPITAGWQKVIYGAGKFLAFDEKSNTIAYSLDGIEWELVPDDTLPPGGSWNVIYTGNKFVGVQSGSDIVVYSDDGLVWTESPNRLPSSNSWSTIAYGNETVVISDIDGHAAWSSDGTAWNSTSIPLYDMSGLAYGDGRFVGVTTNGDNRVAYSSDGATWTKSTEYLPYDDFWQYLTYGNGKFITMAINYGLAVGQFTGYQPEQCTRYPSSTVATECESVFARGTSACDGITCSCTRGQMLDADYALVDNVGPMVELSHTFATNEMCLSQCAMLCAETAAYDNDATQKKLICGE